MEHIVQFGVSIDDDAIMKIVASKASDEVLKQVRKFAEGSYYSESKLERMAKEEIAQVVADNKDLIIDKAVKCVCDNIRNSKRYREALADVVDCVKEVGE